MHVWSSSGNCLPGNTNLENAFPSKLLFLVSLDLESLELLVAFHVS